MGRNAANSDMGRYPTIVPPAYTGVALLFCWTYLMFYATSAGVEAAAPISLYSAGYTVSALCMVITLVVVAFFVPARTRLLTSKGAKIATGVCLPIGTGILIACGSSFNIALLVIGGVVTGVFSGALSAQWAVAYKRVGLRVAVGSFPALMAMSVGICVTLMYLPREVLAVATVALPLVSEILFHEVRKEPWPEFEDLEADAPDRPINFVLLLLPFAAYALATGFLDYSSNGNNYTFAFYAFGAIVPVIIAGVYLFIVERRAFLSAFLVPCAFLVVSCVPFLAMTGIAPFSPFISIGELGIEVLLFIVPIGFAHFFSIDTLKTYALGRMVYVLFSAIGWYVAQFVYAQFEAVAQSQMSLVIIFVGVEVLVVSLIVAIVKTQKIMPNEELPAEQADDRAVLADESDEHASDRAAFAGGQPVPGAVGSFGGQEDGVGVEPSSTGADAGDSAIDGPSESPNANGGHDALFDEYGLSKREREVCLLLARGYTSPRIQKELYIAAGTVNYHSRNIYAKLGVHSKQELIELFE